MLYVHKREKERERLLLESLSDDETSRGFWLFMLSVTYVGTRRPDRSLRLINKYSVPFPLVYSILSLSYVYRVCWSYIFPATLTTTSLSSFVDSSTLSESNKLLFRTTREICPLIWLCISEAFPRKLNLEKIFEEQHTCREFFYNKDENVLLFWRFKKYYIIELCTIAYKKKLTNCIYILYMKMDKMNFHLADLANFITSYNIKDD